jgi:hypothetical protein
VEGIEYVDVNVPLARLFNPSPETLEGIPEVLNTPPVPLEQLERHHH